jgi:hypothetical protein
MLADFYEKTNQKAATYHKRRLFFLSKADS